MPRLTIHDFRVTDSVLAQSDPNAGDVVYLGPHGTGAFPFVVVRKVAGPSGVYVDAFDITGSNGPIMEPVETTYEVDGESWPRDVVTELRNMHFPAPGAYTLRFFEYDDKVLDVPVQVLQQDPPYGVIMPGPVDASLSKSTLCWITVPQPDGSSKTFGIWYGYEGGRIYVLFGPGEQQLPGLDTAATVHLIARSKDKQSRIGEIDCVVELLPKDAAWETLANDLLVGRRLNLRDAATAVTRWRNECEIAMLTPIAAPVGV